MERFGEILTELRQDRAWTQRQLAERLHISIGTISNYENNNHLPDVEKFIDLASLFGVSTDYLLGLCHSQVSPDHWNQPLLGSLSAGEVVKLIQTLPPKRKEALSTILYAFSATQKQNKEGDEP